jgi:ketosteroid isomerase-like protein
MSEASAAELLAGVYACAGQGDWDGVAARVTEDFTLYEAPSTPFGGEYRGKDAMQRCAAAVFGTWDNPRAVTLELVGGKDWAVHVLAFTMTSKTTGNTFTQTVCEAGKFEGGKLKELRIHYFDTAQIAVEGGA